MSKTSKSPHRRLSLCSLPAPKQFNVSLRSVTSFAQWAIGGAWQSAHRKNADVFPFLGRLLGCHRGSEFLGRHEVLFSAFDRNQPSHHLPGYSQRCAVTIASLFFL